MHLRREPAKIKGEKAMKNSLIALAAVFLLAGSASATEKYKVVDEGGFGRTGRLVEFSSRYGWDSYKVEYDIRVDKAANRLARGSNLKLTVKRNDGSTWSYKCKAKDTDSMWANVNRVYGNGLSIMTECRINPKKFAKAVDLVPDLVGDPTLVFHVMIQDGKARPGVHKGLYFLGNDEIAAGGMHNYASERADPSNLGVLFATHPAPRHGRVVASVGYLR